ncbi:MAG: response regulator, partial [Shimia sp.]|nr:response regulator [Shimia sp.]
LAALAAYVLAIYRRANQRGIALQQANQRMQTILTTSLDGVIVTDLDGNVLEFNQAAEETLGYKFSEVCGRPIIELVAPDDMLDTHLANAQRIKEGQAGTIEGQGRVTLRAKRKTGEVFPVELSIQRADDGQQELFIAFLHDISKRIAAEAELLETRDKALAGERAKAEFLTMMSHEIRTPLNGVLGNLSLLNETQLTSTQTRYVRNMDLSGRVLMRHVDSVLDIARFQSGAMEFDIACTDLSSMLTDLVNSQIGQAGQKGTTLAWHWVGARMKWGRTDRAALEQVLLNLLGNAIKFTPGGQVEIEIEVLPDSSPNTPTIEIRVIDTGVGIAKQDMDSIFDDFVTSDTSFGRAIGGTGLGLGITRRIVEGLGGTIGVQSEPGKGSTFWVRLPMEEGRDPGSVQTQALASTPLRHMTILLVEDNAINREVATEILEKDGHTVVAAADGQTGVNRAAAARFDLILMDITMPGMDGLAATRAIRSGGGASSDVPIIAVSANILPQERDRFVAAGMHGFLPKPLNIHDMRQALAGMDHARRSQPTELIDMDQLSANREGMGEAVFERLLDRFVAEVNGFIATQPALSGEGFLALERSLHSIAGSAAVFGAAQLRYALLETEGHASARNHAETQRHFDALPQIWHETKSALKTLTAA